MESCRRAVKERILTDMLGSVSDSVGGGWRVLIVDALTTRVMSSTLRMSDIQECNVSVVEDLNKSREPLHQPAIYFIQPSADSVSRVLNDFGGPDGTGKVAGMKQLYPSAHIFFSNKASAEVIERLKANPRLIKSLKTLKELNLEFMTVDSRTMITDHPSALVTLLGDTADRDRTAVTREVDAVVGRLATLFTTFKEFPAIRYQGVRADAADVPGGAVRRQLPKLFASRLYERLSGLQRAGQLPGKESCDLLVLDRSYDAVAPFIHEWSYEALAYDLVPIEGNVYKYEVSTGESSTSGTREALLEETDELWLELRHRFIADVYSVLATRFKEFQSKNKAARVAGSKVTEAMSGASIRQLIMALPQYREQLSRMALHIQLSSEVKTATNARGLTDVGEVEQDLVLGEKHSKDMLEFFAQHQANMDPYDKVRLLACYLATHPGKLDVSKRSSWTKAAGLTGQDMAALVGGLGRLGVKVMETPEMTTKSGFFGTKKGSKGSPNKATRIKRGGEDEYALNRFAPLLYDILSDMGAGRLSQDDFPYVRQPSGDADQGPQVASARTGRTGLNWAKRGQDGSGGAGPAGRRLVVFIIGGATRGEMRVVHQMAEQLNRDVVLGTTSVEKPATFVDLLYSLAPASEDVI